MPVWTNRQTDKQTNRQTGKQANRQTGKQANSTGKQFADNRQTVCKQFANRQTGKQFANRQTGKQQTVIQQTVCKQSYRKTDIQTNRHTDMPDIQTYRQTDKQTFRHSSQTSQTSRQARQADKQTSRHRLTQTDKLTN